MITEIAKKINLNKNDIILYGDDIAKIKKNEQKKQGNLILVTSITPTKHGEGKTTMVIGINDALRKLRKNSIAVVREPSLGPTFGLKGGATGGEKATIFPEMDINLSFTGDFHAIEDANNLICALIDNHIFQGNELNINSNDILFHRCIDVCDRSLRSIEINHTTSSFDITAASEIMGIMTLCQNEDDLKKRIDDIIIGLTYEGNPVYFKQLQSTNAIYELLKKAMLPNLVRSLENNPVIVHMGPFANVSIGCNSLISTKLATSLCDYTLVEAGFGSDLGCEKFFDIKCRTGNLNPNLVILNVTIRALKEHNCFENQFDHLKKHIENIHCFTSNLLIVLNKFEDDNVDEITKLQEFLKQENISFEICEAFLKGSDGAMKVAEKVIDLVKTDTIHFLYSLEDELKDKIDTICTKMYHVNKIIYKKEVLKKIENIKKNHLDSLPICIAKSPLSLNGNKDTSLDYIEITDIKVNNGAGYIVVYSGNIMTMPGLPKHPRAMDF